MQAMFKILTEGRRAKNTPGGNECRHVPIIRQDCITNKNVVVVGAISYFSTVI